MQTVDFKTLNQALVTLEDVYLSPPEGINIDSTIKRFEYTFETFWVYLRQTLIEAGFNIYPSRDLIEEAFECGILNEKRLWRKMLKDRNNTVHAYDKVIAEQIFSNIKQYAPAIRAVVDRLKEYEL